MGEGDRPGLTDELGELVIEIAHTRMNADPEKAYPWAEVPTLLDSAESVDDLWVMEATAERIIAAGRDVLTEIRKRMASDVAEFGAIRLGATLYRVGKKGSREIIEGQEKPLLAWLAEDLKDAVPASAVRITAVRAVAEKRDLDAKVVEATFYFWDEDPDELHALLRIHEGSSSIPQYFAKMSHGDRR
jgi:hypothetical protein